MGRWKEEEEQEKRLNGVKMDGFMAGLGRHIQNAASPSGPLPNSENIQEPWVIHSCMNFLMSIVMLIITPAEHIFREKEHSGRPSSKLANATITSKIHEI